RGIHRNGAYVTILPCPVGNAQNGQPNRSRTDPGNSRAIAERPPPCRSAGHRKDSSDERHRERGWLRMAISFEAQEDATPVAVEYLIDSARTAYKAKAVEAIHAVAEKFEGAVANREVIRDPLPAEANRIVNDK